MNYWGNLYPFKKNLNWPSPRLTLSVTENKKDVKSLIEDHEAWLISRKREKPRTA